MSERNRFCTERCSPAQHSCPPWWGMSDKDVRRERVIELANQHPDHNSGVRGR